MKGIPAEYLPALRRLAPPFFEEGAKQVYVSWDGDRLYVGAIPAGAYRDKEGTPENTVIFPEDLTAPQP